MVPHVTVGDDPAELLRHRRAPVQVQIHARDLLDVLDDDFAREIDALNERLSQCREAAALPDDPRDPWVQCNAEWDHLRQTDPDEHARRLAAMSPEQGRQIMQEYKQKVADWEHTLTADERAGRSAERAAFDEIEDGDDRITAQVTDDLRTYAENLDAAIRAHLRVLDLPVPVIIDILDPDGPLPATDLYSSAQDASTPIDQAIASAIERDSPPIGARQHPGPTSRRGRPPRRHQPRMTDHDRLTKTELNVLRQGVGMVLGLSSWCMR